MEVGKLYKTKKYYWFLYPSQDIAEAAYDAAAASASTSDAAAVYWSKRLECNVSFIPQKSMFMLLEQSGKFCKVLSTEGMVGWIILDLWCKKDIVEVKAE